MVILQYTVLRSETSQQLKNLPNEPGQEKWRDLSGGSRTFVFLWRHRSQALGVLLELLEGSSKSFSVATGGGDPVVELYDFDLYSI